MQKRDSSVWGGVKAAAGKSREEGHERIPISSDADYKPPRDYPEIRNEIARLNNEINHIGINVNQIAHLINSGIYREEDWHRLYVFLNQIKRLIQVEGNREDEELNYAVDVNPKRNGSLLAEIRLRFQDGAIVVNQAAIYRNWKGESFVNMPHWTLKDTKEIQNVCFPITSEFSAELKECIMRKYEEKLEL